MGSIIGILMLVAAMIFITAILFGGWVIISIARVVFRTLGLALGGCNTATRARVGYSGPVMAPPQMIVCSNPRCRNANPGGARFCRRCGTHLYRTQSTQRVAVRRAAMW